MEKKTVQFICSIVPVLRRISYEMYYCDGGLVYSPSLVFLLMVFQLHCVLFFFVSFVAFFCIPMYRHELSRFINSTHKRSNKKTTTTNSARAVNMAIIFFYLFCLMYFDKFLQFKLKKNKKINKLVVFRIKMTFD